MTHKISNNGNKMKLKLSTALIGAAIASSASFTPTPAYACGVCSPLTAIVSASTQTILTSLSLLTTTVLQAIQSSTETIIGVNEKNITAGKELKQGSINYDAANIMQDATIEAQEKFTTEQAKPYKVCEQMAQSVQTQAAFGFANESLKIASAKRALATLYPKSKATSVTNVLSKWTSKYCTQVDFDRQLCTKVADAVIQAGSVRADIMMHPTTNFTYSDDEKEAASDFIDMVTNPTPEQPLPLAMEKTESGKAFRVAQMNSKAQMSVATTSLEAIRASKIGNSTAASNAAGYNGSLSMLGLMRKFTDDKFGNAKYSEELQVKNKNGLLKELSIQMAFSNWVDFQSFVQNERIETILATQLANSSKRHADEELARARAEVSR